MGMYVVRGRCWLVLVGVEVTMMVVVAAENDEMEK